jgi:DNA-binding HxlR family transcriptional regulator
MLDLKTGVDEKFVEENMCPIGLAAHLLGDKWIPIIIRDIALFNRRTFNDILKNNRENISSGSLSSRLKLMLDLNLLEIGTSERHAQKNLTDDADRMEWLLEQLRTFNIHKTKEPEPLWWA